MSRTLATNRFLVRNFVSSLNFTASDFVTFSGPAFGTAGTISFYLYKSSFVANTYSFDSTNGNRYLFYCNSSVGWAFFLNSVEIADSSFIAQNFVDLGKWTNITITWDNSLSSQKEKFYKNGVLFDTRNITISTSATPTNFWLNRRFDNTGKGAELLDDMIICSTALTQTEITNWYTKGVQPASTTNRWKMNEGSGSTVNDSAGSLTGTITGATYSTTNIVSTPRVLATNHVLVRNFGTSLQFDGSTSYVAVAETANLPLYNNTAFSVSAWIYPNDANATDRRFWCERPASGSAFYGIGPIGVTNNKFGIRLFVRNDANVAIYDGSTAGLCPIGAWSHVVLVDNNGTITCYINGVAVSIGAGSYTRGTLTLNRSTIGANFSSSVASVFGGFIDEVRVYKSALTSGQAVQLFTAGSEVDAPNLVGYWKFDEGSGTTATDSSGNNNTGTITAAPYSSTKASTPRTLAT